MRITPSENKQVRLNELSDQQIAEVNAERKLNAAKRGLDETRREKEREQENAALFGRPVNADEMRRLDAQEAHYAELVAQCQRELADVKDAPARREQEAKEAAGIIREITILDQRISAAMESIAPMMREADELIERVISIGTVNKGGWHTLKPAFRGMETLLERLRFWARTTGERGDGETFAERLARYRRIGEPKPVPQPPTFTGRYERSKPLPRQARENSAARLKMTPSGVESSRS